MMSQSNLPNKNDVTDDDDLEHLPSKTQIKKDVLALTQLGKTIVNLSPADTAKIPLDDELKQAIESARNMRMGALKRQLQFIGKCLRQRDTDEIKRAVDSILHARQSAGREFKQLEKWRERLLEAGRSGNQALTDYCAEFPHTDVQRLRRLIRQTHQERKQEKPPKYFRELFQLIKQDNHSDD